MSEVFFSLWSPAIQQQLPRIPPPPTLTDDENLVLALRLRDGRPNPVPGHRRNGACRYAKHYQEADCDWCRAVERREAASTTAEPPSNVIIMSHRFRPLPGDASAVRRIA